MQKISLKGYRLSMQQARLWMLQGESQVWYAQCAVSLDGKLKMPSFLGALQKLVQHHDILRTAFRRLPGMEIPVQVVSSSLEVNCPVIDLKHLAAADQCSCLHEHLTRLQGAMTNLELHPLFTVALLRFSAEQHLLLIRLPALCADEYTLVRIVSELSLLYASSLEGREQDEESLQYAEVAAWQEELQQSEKAETLRGYWREIDLTQLISIRVPFAQQTSQSSPSVSATEGSWVMSAHELVLEDSVSAQIKQRALQFDVSIEAWFLACWEAVLWRLNGMQDTLLGVACNGRSYEGLTEDLVKALGPCARHVPLEIRLGRDWSFVQVVKSANKALLGAIKRQVYFSWEDESTSGTSVNGSHFFPVSFEYTLWPASFVVGNINFSLYKSSCRVENFSLKLSIVQVGEQVRLCFQHNPKSVKPVHIEQLASAFQTLLRSGIQEPQGHVSTLALLEPTTQASLLAMGRASTQVISPQTLQQLFEAQVQRQPNQMAVISTQKQLTYQQLNERSNQLAQVLRQRGVGPNVLVGLCLPRQAHMLVGLLGILKAGGAYLPLDATSPAARLTYQLHECGVTLLLTQEAMCPHLPEWGGTILCLEELATELAQASLENHATGNVAEDLIYVIYTSGSTGVPKGVMVCQSSVVNYTQALCEQLRAEAGWQYATVSTLAADLGNTAIFCALASGGCVQVLDYEIVTSGEAMANWAAQHPIDVLKIVPSHLSALLESERAQELLPRQALVFGGEPLSGHLVERVQRAGRTCQIYNHYGPTEATIGVLVNPLEMQGRAIESSSVALGRPLINTQVYVLDQRMQLLPAGVVGELYIGGAGLALGYQQQAAQTAERFVPHPYSELGNERLYRTGDLAYYGEEGKIFFVGRSDGQVKLRGYRIELGEIEAALRQHPLVWDCAVQLQEDGPGSPRLIGYVVARTAAGLASQDLREMLREKLPEYMLPSGFVMLESLPLTANGKLDRQRLPQPELLPENEPVTQGESRSPIEEMLVQMWKDLLQIPGVGIDDNFFALGGHSLLATRTMARLQAMFQVVLPVQALFEAPTVAGLAQRIEQALRKNERIEMPPLVAGARPEEIPLSFAQQRLWFLDQLEPGSTVYLIPRTLRIEGDIEVYSLKRSLQELIHRHESLRTTFAEREGQPVQVIHPASDIPLFVIDLQGLQPEQRELEARRLVSLEAQNPSDLTRGPLVRTTLLRVERQAHVLLLTLHHIITDGWSTEVLVRELITLYQAFVARKPSPLSPLPIQYADYALWQRQWLQGEVLDAQLTYWRKQLANILPLELPTDHPRPVVQTYRGARQVWQLPVELSEDLQVLSQQENVTLFMLLLAAFHVLLARYTGQNDISVGSPIANRRQGEIEDVIGFFVNTLVLRANLSGNPSFRQVLQNVRAMCLGAYAHQDIPFEKVVGELEPVRDMSRSPLFQVMFLLQNASREQGDLAAVSVRSLNMERTISKFDLTLALGETRQGLRCTLEYNIDLFEAETVSRLLGHWQTLLQGVVHDPQAHLSELPLLTHDEQEQLLGVWNATQREYPQDVCVHQLFEQQVQRTPEAVALVFGEETLTYIELDRRANQLAHYLRRLGIGPNDLVGLYMERSIEMVIGMLGVLKAGGAYVPLDTSTPYERLSVILEDLQASAFLTREHLRDSLLKERNVLICLDTDWETIAGYGTANFLSNTSPSYLAYVIYTSGSTGRPKGVLITHANIVHSTQARFAYYDEPVRDYLLLSPFFFDISMAGLYWTLCQGGRVVLLREDFRADLPQLPQLIMLQHISHLLSIPSLYALILSQAQPEQLASLCTVIVGGEISSVSLVQRHQEVVPQADLYNEYGPTEGTVWSSVYRCQFQQHEMLVPIGRPITNVQMYLLDQELHPVPIGVPGELFIGGRGIGRGYLDRADLTAEQFIPHPYSKQPGERLYRTGDLARYNVGGSIEFLGRSDQQVKIRGYRIELGEIEVQLRQHPDVQECVVLAREDMPGDKRLVAYVVLRPGQTSSRDGLRTFLKEHLPEYMLPTQIVLLGQLPLTANGKVDRRALPAPESKRSEFTETFVGPRNNVETTLAHIWSQVLHVGHIGIHNNFFALGGDSILSIQVVARARQAGLHITPRQLFQNQSIAQLSGVVTSSVTPYAEQVLVTGPVPLTPIQHWFFLRHLPMPHHFNQAVMLETRQQLRPAWIQQALLHLILHHDALRLRFAHQAGSWQQEMAGAPSPDHPFFLCVDLSALPASQQQVTRALLTEEAQASIDLAAGVLLRALFFVYGSGSVGHLLLVIHHLAVDGVSWRILLEDLELLCRQLCQEEPLHLAAKTTSWQRWVQLLQEYAQTEELRSTQRYWLAPQRRLVIPLPVDMSGDDNTIASSETVRVSLNVKLTQILLQEVPSAYHTQINDVLLTTLAHVFADWTGQRRLLIDLEGHGREELTEEVDVSRTAGWFTTVFPMLLDIEQVAGEGEELKAVKEQLRQVPQKGLSYGVLRYLSTDPQVAEQFARLPHAEVVFNYLGQFNSSVDEQPLFHQSQVSAGARHSDLEPRSHLLDITGQIISGELHIVWRYGRHIHWHATIERLARSFIAYLENLIVHCQSRETSEYTPSDFPLTVLNQQQVDVLTQLIPQEKQGRLDPQIEDIYPLSPMQAGLLFHCLYTPKSAVYCGYLSWTLRGPLNADAWQWSWQQVINRHAILRTFFVWQGLAEPLQVVCKQVKVPWTMHDWRSLSAQERQQRLDMLQQREEQEGFDLQRAPLLRLSLIRLEEQTYYFHLALHHLLVDGWSQSRLIGEVQAYYLSYSREHNLQLAPVRPYRDYIAWLQEQDTEQAEQFWRRYLLGFTSPTRLAVDQQPYPGREQSDRVMDIELRSLPEEMTVMLQHLGKRHQLTLNTIVQGVWALLLSRYSGEADVLFGATVSGRPTELVGIETMIGLFINTLPVRVRVMQEASLLSWLTQLQESQSEVRQYEYTPLVNIQRWSEVPIEQPLFDSLLLFQNYPLDPMKKEEESELAVQGKRSVEYTNYALTLKAAVAGNSLSLRLSYDTGHFDATTIARLMDHVQMLLEAIALHPQQQLADLPPLTTVERHTLLMGWNDTLASFSTESSIYELFEQQAKQTPDAIALVFQDTCVTYRFVRAAVQQVAGHLQALGIEAGVPIGLCVERSLEQVIGMLGILQAGGAYVPLDPTYPHDRLAFMLEDSHAVALVTQPWLLEIFPEQKGPFLLLTDALCDNKVAVATPRKCSSQQVAYIIYTSGSTGRPKGTMISHRAVGNFFSSMSRQPGMTMDDRILAVTSVSFDIAALELLQPLTLGACVHIASQQMLADGIALATLLETSGATLLQATPSTWGMLIAAGWTGNPHLKMLCGGEALPIELASQLQSRGAVLWNMYGPTETTIWSAIQDVSRAEKNISIGSAIDNTRLYVLNGQALPVPIGVVGELYIAGEGVAYGYWQHPDLSAERFLPDPFAQQVGARMYRTGDRVRWLENGQLEYLGRIDQQIKLRGHRIELSEIEAVLRDHAAVQEAVVVLRGESEANKYLLAYVVAQAGQQPTYRELQQHLRKRLPDYMLPTALVYLETLPLTPNGKVDRKALPALDPGQFSLVDKFMAPETQLQEELAAIWTELLHLPQVGIHHNFFELGGNSLLATRLMVRIRSVFLVEVPLRSLFEASTIAELALVIEHLQNELIEQADSEEMAHMLATLE